jgi:hypothetical protein
LMATPATLFLFFVQAICPALMPGLRSWNLHCRLFTCLLGLFPLGLTLAGFVTMVSGLRLRLNCQPVATPSTRPAR